MKKFIFVYVAALLFVSQSNNVDASYLSINYFDVSPGNEGSYSTRGWGFTPTTDISVNSLGLWDEGADGFFAAHRIAIWSDSGIPLVETTIRTGTDSLSFGPVIDGGIYRFESIAPLVLSANTQYIIAAESFGGDSVLSGNTFSLDSVLKMTSGMRGHFNSFSYPELVFGGNGYFNANFTFDVINSGPVSDTSTPEPASLLLLSMGVIGLAGLRKRFYNRTL